MPELTRSRTREIIDDFAKEIQERKIKSAKPSKTVINFRNDIIDRYERDIVKVPIDLLRFRKDNGRIASDVLDHEYTKSPLDECDLRDQQLLKKFLERKDPEKTEILTKNILHSGQRQPAIITCDGFLINGNRRKMVMERLRKEYRKDERFQYMNVVILPGKGDEGGPPTLLEIEKLENRYQLQSEGKSEYYGFDRALSIRRKMQIGLSLEAQIEDDPQYAGASERQKRQAIGDINKGYLDPLKCIDRYLVQFRREHQYHTVSSRIGDRQGRWQAFLDYSNTYNSKFMNPHYRLENKIEEDEIGTIEEAAFDIIRLRVIPAMPKVHLIMRDLHKYCRTEEGKMHLLNIPNEVDPVLPLEEQYEDPELQKPLPRTEVDAKWAAKNKEAITRRLKSAKREYTKLREEETPIGLLDAALKKLKHRDMELSAISPKDYKNVRHLLNEIQREAKHLEKQLFILDKQS